MTVAEPRWGGWQETANALHEAGFPTSRQMVYGWWRRRAKIGFPGGRVLDVPLSRGGTRRRVQLPIDEVIEWRKRYVPDRGGRPPGRKRGDS
jgi:hypothetical protein